MKHFTMDGETYPVWENQKGYACVTLDQDGREKAVLLHRLVWELAHGPVPPGHEVHHLDHDRGNWQLTNLAVMDRQAHQQLHRESRRSTRKYREAGNLTRVTNHQ